MSLLASLAEALDDMLAPLEDALTDEVSFAQFLNRLGWSATVDPATMPAIRAGFGVSALFGTVRTIADELDSGQGDELTVAEQLIEALVPIVQQLQALATANPAGLPFPLNRSAFWDQAPLELVDYLVLRYVELYQPKVFVLLYLTGVAEITTAAPTGTGRIPYEKYSINPNRLGQLITDPAGLIRTLYHWGDTVAPFDFGRTLLALKRVFVAFGLPVQYVPPRKELIDVYYPAVAVPADVRELTVPFVRGEANDGDAFIELGLLALPLPPDGSPAQAPSGLLFTPLLDGYITEAVPISRDFKLELGGGFDASGSIGVQLWPGKAKLRLAGAAVTIDAHASLIGAPQKPWILVGDPDSSRLELGGLDVGIRVKGAVTDPEIILQAGTGTGPTPAQGGAGVVIDFSKGDGFLQRMLGGQTYSLSFAGSMTWSTKHGLGITGQAKLEANLPVHISIADVLKVDTIYISLRAGTTSNESELDVAIAGGLDIGPVAASVDRLGVRLLLTPRGAQDPPGNLGRFELGFGFKPPNGLGLAIDAGPVVGGGYILFDPDKGQYAGALELKLEDIQVKAIGVLDTRLPDGSSGFSFLIIITTEFTPIQLGFGFTLNGVGGLAGINRTMVLDALRAGFKAHTLNSILFPVDPIKNAPKIISDITAVFPPSDGRYVFGPMIEIGWGVPSLVIGEIGIVLEIPSPVRLAILGLMRAAIPAEKAPVIIIHVDVLGTVDFGLKKLAIDASIYDSRIVAFTLLGDMALRLNWGANALFVFSVGGLHPQFQPPPEFPKLARLTVSLGYGDIVRLSLDSYFAVTSNTVQFGAHLELRIGDGVGVHGYLGFDALFILSPFHFLAEMRAGVELHVGSLSLLSIDLDLRLAGPIPFTYDGIATIHILFFDIGVHVSGTIVGGTAPELPPAPVMAPLISALRNPQSWHAPLPDDAERAVSLVAPKPDDKSLYVYPAGQLTVSQSVVPLATPITRFGSAVPSDGDDFTISAVSVDGTAVTTAAVPGQFAPAQYRDMSDADKLSTRSFEPFPAGVSIGGEGIGTGVDKSMDLTYDTQIIDDLLLPSLKGRIYRLSATALLAMAGQGAGARSAVLNTGVAKYWQRGTQSPIRESSPSYVVASTDDLTVNNALTSTPTNMYLATVALQQHLARHPEDTGRYQVVAVHEAAV